MKTSATVRTLASLLVIVSLLAPAVTARAKKGEKNYRRGLEYEAAQQWERAAQEFTLAVAANPSETEYQLHYRRALYSASQALMQQAQKLSERGDYLGAYHAYRQAYSYDATNELAKSEMERMSRLQLEKENGGAGASEQNGRPAGEGGGHQPTLSTPPASASVVRANYQESFVRAARPDTRRVISFAAGVELKSIIRKLAQDLDLNVIFDAQTFGRPRTAELELRDVTTAQALDYLFMQENLFFQRLDRRTIFVADVVRRAQYQQLAVRTFYLKNAEPEQTKTLIQSIIPAQPGRPQTIAIADKTTNSLTVRDTPENLRQIEKIIKNVDKDRAAVAIDVNIYEVSRGDLMQFGNQVGDSTTLGRLGQSSPLSVVGGSRQVAMQMLNLPTALGAAFALPTSTISAFQSRERTRVLASTTVNAFDGKKSTHNIGRRVPIQTAQVTPLGYSAPNGGNNNNQTGAGVNQGLFGGTGYPVIQYVETGLILEFTPQVFPNHDVQLEMKITSKETSGAGETLTPTFTERSIDGMARIANNHTMMIASIAQDRQSNGRKGLPVVGLVPILGRFFTAPTKDNQQTDIVITVTPRVLRAPVITPEDEESRPSGTIQSPTTETLAEMMERDQHDEQLAALKQAAPRPAAAPAATETEAPAYLPAPKIFMGVENAKASATPPAMTAALERAKPSTEASPITTTTAAAATTTEAAHGAGATALNLSALPGRLSVGQKHRVAMTINTSSRLGLAVLALRYNPRVVAVRAVTTEGLFPRAAGEGPRFTQTTDPTGALLVSLNAPAGKPMLGSDTLLFFDIEALAPGETELSFDPTAVHLITDDGRMLTPSATRGRIVVGP